MKKIDVNELEKYGKFAVILKCLLAKKGVTQSELANSVGLSMATITHYVKGKNTPSQTNLEKIANALKVSPRVFYDDIDEFTPYLNSTEMRFATRLADSMAEKGVTQDDLAKEISVSRQTINYYVNMKQLPTADILFKIAKFFNKPMSYFINLDSDGDEMKMYVTKIPETKNKCMFIKESDDGTYTNCIFGGVCELCNGECPRLEVFHKDEVEQSK